MSNVPFPPDPDASTGEATNCHWGRLNLSLLWIYRGSVPPGTREYMDSSATLTAWLIRKGTVMVKIQDRCDQAGPGEWLFPKPVPRLQKFSADAEILSVRFRMEWPNGEQMFSEGMGVALKASLNPDLEQAARRLERVVQFLTKTRFTDPSFTRKNLQFLEFIQLEKAVLGWTGSVYRALLRAGLKPNLQQASDPRIGPILKQLDSWPLDEPFRTEALARQTGFSRSNLERIVAGALGSSSKSYLDRRRLNHALQCLRIPTIPIKQIAMETGFRHASSFCAWFKNKTGRYPGELAEQVF